MVLLVRVTECPLNVVVMEDRKRLLRSAPT
jgi:hypothetical protein